MAGYSSLCGREISKKIRDLEYDPFIKVGPQNVYFKYRVAQKPASQLIMCTVKYVFSFVIA